MMPSRLIARPKVSETETTRDGGVGSERSTVPVLHQLAESFSRRPVCVVGADGEVYCLALVDGAKGYVGVIFVFFAIVFVVRSGFESSGVGHTSSDLRHREFQVDESTTIGEGTGMPQRAAR